MCSCILCGCNSASYDSLPSSDDRDDKVNVDRSETLSSLIYKKGSSETDYTVMIKEDNDYVPYYVLTDNYNGTGNCLLLRKNLIEDNIPFCNEEHYSVYYNGCYVNYYLNNEYEKHFDSNFLGHIKYTDVIITGSEGVTAADHVLDTVKSKFFILSKKEVTGASSSISMAEGEQLDYFKELENIPACKISNQSQSESWWLRTVCLSDESVINAVGDNGAVGIVGMYGPNGPYLKSIRPAFCMDSDTKINVSDGQNYLDL